MALPVKASQHACPFPDPGRRFHQSGMAAGWTKPPWLGRSASRRVAPRLNRFGLMKICSAMLGSEGQRNAKPMQGVQLRAWKIKSRWGGAQVVYAPLKHPAWRNNRGTPMLDLLAVVLGAGGILLMAGYAALCDRA